MIGDVDILEVDSKKRSLKSGTMTDIKNAEIISPPAKRMKQARLPFLTLTNKPNLSSTPSPQITKKSKLAEKSGSGKAKHVDKNTTPLKKADTLQGKKPGTMKARKIGFSSSEVAGKPCAPPEPEVSSSSEDTKPSEKECDSTVTVASSDCTSTAASSKKIPKSASLDRFVQSTQQPHVSTSAIIDLTDADDEMEDDEDFEPPKSATKKSKAEKRKRESPTQSPSDTSAKTPEVPQEDDTAINTSVSSISSLEEASSDEESCKEVGNHSNSSEKDKEDILMEAVEKVLKEEEDKKPQEESLKIPATPVTPSNALKPIKQTPMSAKALQRLKEQEEKKEEKLKLREDKKRKLEEENEMKKRQKLEQKQAKEEEKEAQRKEKAEEKKKKEMEKQLKKEKEEQERMEKKKAKEEERLKKQEELEAKQEEKKKKQEERIKQEEEKKQKEAAELSKKSKQSQVFKNFFSVQAQAPVKKPEVKGWFAPFEVKSDQVLAPCRRVNPKDLDLEQVNKHLEAPSSGSLYLDELKSGKFKPRKDVRTPGPARAAQESSMDVAGPSIPEDVPTSKKKKKRQPEGPKKPDGLKMKMLQFHENYRPAYYGTWQKETSVVAGRTPFKKDTDTFDYEVDSDDEWEEPGESLSNSEGEDEDGDADSDDEEEDGFFVPHGYLSAGEGGEDDEDTDNLKARQAAKAKAWDNEIKRRCEALKPMIITFIQVASTNKTRQDERKKLEAYQAMPLTNLPIATSFTKREKAKGKEESSNAMEGEGAAAGTQRLGGRMGNKLKPVPEEAMPELMNLVHGNMAGIKSLIREFRDYWRRKQHRLESSSPGAGAPAAASPGDSPSLAAGDQEAARESPVGEAGLAPGQDTSPSPVPGSTGTPSPQYLDHIGHVISKRQLDLKINYIAVRERRPQHFKRICWYVHDRFLEKYKLTDLPVPTAWVNGVGMSDGQSSPLPPTNIAARPAAALPKPVVSKPVPAKVPNLSEVGTVSSLLKASKEHRAALAKQHIFIPSNTMPSAFNNVVGVSSASGTLHLQGGTQFQSTPSISYIPQGSTLVQPGLVPFQVMPIQMQQAINPAAFNMSNLLQQAAASSLLANMHHTSALGNTLAQPPNTFVQPPKTNVLPNTKGVPQNMPGVAQNTIRQDLTSVKLKHSAPILKPNVRSPPPGGVKLNSSADGSAGSAPSLPSIKKVSPQRLNSAIAKLYESNNLSESKEKTSPAPVKKTKTLASFFSVQNPKKSDNKPQETPSETQKE
ncbi:chromatin assembly factor 1 subunit A isoform X2 [Strongylocentrotus purpuratus]|uniref:Chromatin assembly factor 1 subunit A n=1 Tax=Strongylocentrotus purpuratus TaxID=7668 RepID=A0A7M7RFA1_STRPU|nr:chromatin assembly factor 1 subunit A isoform X2 [Strongylocentrotus purpuratus]